MNIFTIIKIFLSKLFIKSRNYNPDQPIIVPRSCHNISRKNINKNVLKVLYTLKNQGYKSYLVGGGVRDLLLDRTPKDFDVVTNAYPDQIKKLFKHCYIIGRRFQLVHVHFGKDIIEVVTFRAKNNYSKHHTKEGMILRDNIYGSIEEDALRRDFTVNALYYNIDNYTLVDYANGLRDLRARQLCLIGDPITRYREDPLRILRAIRFAAKLQFNIHEQTKKPIESLKKLIFNIAPARLYDEYIKLFFYGHAAASFELLKQYKLLEILFPRVRLEHFNFIERGLKYIDEKFANNQQLHPAWGVAVLLWSELDTTAAKPPLIKDKAPKIVSYKYTAEALLSEQNRIINLSKRLIIVIKDIWLMQIKLTKISSKNIKKAEKLASSVKFSAAFEFLLLRQACGDKKAQKIAAWWHRYLNR